MKKIIIAFVILLILSVFATAKETKTVQEPNAAERQRQAAAVAGLPLEKIIALGNDVNMVLVFIPAGEFGMGSPESEKKRGKDEGPVHHVKISKPFYVGKYEVTQLQYQTIFHSTSKIFYSRDYNNPADRVSYNQANRFAEELSLLYRKAGLRFRLPTEAEWEYACRAGTTTPFYTGETISSEQANYDATAVYGNGVKGRYLERASTVGSYPPNAFGLYDMHGNVWEWCRDRYIKKFYQDSPSIDPMAGGDEPIRRGGAWDSKPEECRSANRDCRKSWRHMDDTGFRIVMEIDNSPMR